LAASIKLVLVCIAQGSASSNTTAPSQKNNNFFALDWDDNKMFTSHQPLLPSDFADDSSKNQAAPTSHTTAEHHEAISKHHIH
jgi:hypothetical protein